MHDPDRDLAPLARRHLIAATVGNALEFYDFLIYALFAIPIGHAFFPSSTAYGSLMLSLATFGAGFVTRPIGAIVLGRYADRAGRRPAMLLCLVLIGASIAAMALIPSYARIGIAAPVLVVIARLVQGFSLGGEVGSNTAFLAEAASPDRRGAAVSWQGASQLAALIAGNLVGVALTAILPPALLDAYGWRLALLLGAAAVPYGWWLRTGLPETRYAREPSASRLAGSESAGAPAGARASIEAHASRLTRREWRILALGLLILSAGTIGTYVSTYVVTYAQHTLHLAPRAGFLAELTSDLVGLPAVWVGGRLSDRYGRRPLNLWSNLAFLVAIYPTFLWIASAPSDHSLIAGMALLAALHDLSIGSVLAALAEALPRSVRSASLGTVYSLSVALFGGTTQLVVTWLIHLTGRAIAPAWYLMAATAVGQIALMRFPETAPVQPSARMSRAVDMPPP